MINFLSIDPGENIGLALFKNLSSEHAPYYTVAIKAKAKDWNVTQQIALHQFKYAIESPPIKGCTNAIIEQPHYMANSAMGQVAASSGALFKLCCIYGAMCYILRSHGYTVTEIPVNIWKGQWKKEHVNARIERLIGISYENHIADAVGLGLHFKGLL